MGGKRAPLIAGAIVVVLVIVAVVVLVLPKKQQVADAKKSLATAQSQQQLLQTQLSALKQAQAQAPHDKAVIANVKRQIPPTADEPGMLLLMTNSATDAGITLWQFTPSTPLADPQNAELTVIPLAFTVKGTYFALAEFLFNVETLPRVAKVQSVQIGAGDTTSTSGPTSAVTSLSMTGTIAFYTTDTSAGPGSQPGPTSGTSSSTSTTTPGG